jgi:dihydrofolate reductase
MRKIIYLCAVSADGFIARPDGDFSWLDRPHPKDFYGMAEFYNSIDTILYGRKTYEIGLRFGRAGDAKKKNFVFSRTLPPSATGHLEIGSPDVKEFAQKLRAKEGKNIWMMGGAEIAGSFLDAGELDEIVANVIPLLIGEGIPLFGAAHRQVPLKLLSSTPYPDGVVKLHYLVER